MSRQPWGDTETRFFYELTPERILDAVETAGVRSTGRLHVCNSFENRVYDVEIEQGGRRRQVIAKFYRPGRWTRDQILEEHRYLADCREAEIPVAPALPFDDGGTLRIMEESGIHFALFERIGGRAPDELSPDQARRLGRLIARVHCVGEGRAAPNRLHLDVETWGDRNLDALIEGDFLPEKLAQRYVDLAEAVLESADPLFDGVRTLRIHGDTHLGNVLWSPEGAALLDFDDMAVGPSVQDLWMLIPGRDDEAAALQKHLVDGYREFRDFDDGEWRLVEAMRALRYIHFDAWLSLRREDPAFARGFPDFGSERWWAERIGDLQEQLERISGQAGAAG